MHQFRILKTGEIKTAFSLREEGEKTYVKFSKDGKEYGYFTHSGGRFKVCVNSEN